MDRLTDGKAVEYLAFCAGFHEVMSTLMILILLGFFNDTPDSRYEFTHNFIEDIVKKQLENYPEQNTQKRKIIL